MIFSMGGGKHKFSYVLASRERKNQPYEALCDVAGFLGPPAQQKASEHMLQRRKPVI